MTTISYSEKPPSPMLIPTSWLRTESPGVILKLSGPEELEYALFMNMFVFYEFLNHSPGELPMRFGGFVGLDDLQLNVVPHDQYTAKPHVANGAILRTKKRFAVVTKNDNNPSFALMQPGTNSMVVNQWFEHAEISCTYNLQLNTKLTVDVQLHRTVVLTSSGDLVEFCNLANHTEEVFQLYFEPTTVP